MKGDKMRIRLIISLCLLLLFLNGCSNNNPQPIIEPIIYEFKEPTKFPFEINDVSTNISMPMPNHIHQFGFNYRNKETMQQISYVLSKTLKGAHPEIPRSATVTNSLDNGVTTYYEETATFQRLYWKMEDGFEARITYYINKDTTELGDYKLKIEDLINLANEVTLSQDNKDLPITIKENSSSNVLFENGLENAMVDYKDGVINLSVYAIGLDRNSYYEIHLDRAGDGVLVFGPEANVNINYGSLKNETNFYPNQDGILSVSMINPVRMMVGAKELRLIITDKNGDVVLKTKPFQIIE